MDILIQLIGGLGIIASIIAFQCKRHNSILLFKTLNEFIFAIQYILLGAYTGATMNLIGCVRNIVFTKQLARKRTTTISAVAFCVFFIVFGLLFWQGKKSILIIVAKVLSTVAYGNKNTTVVRLIVLVTSTSWLIYNSLVFSVAGVLCEAFTIVSLLIGVIRFDIIPHFAKREK